ncbi:MAG TPA: type I-C CRISPR-associated protein Cas8c/Csd1 [Candidatus Aphodovivens avistercoris]|nr:type I-C CRISPR-associated protein Cas8c/Csd1 [Candidatus Aphodovivens avistercoris]
MILQALAAYYDYLVEHHSDKVARYGWCPRRVAYLLEIDSDGELLAAIPSTDEKGWERFVPEQVKRSSGIAPNALCDNSSYFLGVAAKGKPERLRKCFEAARDLHIRLLSRVDSPAARAVVRFFETWDPDCASEHPVVSTAGEKLLGGGNLLFSYEGQDVLEDPSIQQAWDSFGSGGENSVVMRCLVTGERAPVARLHPAIKGIAGAQSMGASLVGFNAPAFESYGHEGEQGLNAPVSERAAFAYATALNYLLSDPQHRVRMGDTTVVYWAEKDDDACSQVVSAGFGAFSFGRSEDAPPEDRDQKLDDIMKAVRSGLPLGNIDMETPFYVLGLAPNAARASVRFFFRDTFGKVVANIAEHYERLEIVHTPKEREYLYPFQLLREIENPNAKKPVASSEIGGALMRSILGNLPYPEALLENALLRTRASRDDPDTHRRKVSRGRMAIIKAFLIKNRKEQVTVGLDEKRKDAAYVLGRLFVTLEEIQYAANSELKVTIADKYLNSACATPSLVFPTLLGLARVHLGKVKKENPDKADHLDRQVMRYVYLLDDLPSNLSPKEQCDFNLGYYHQKLHNINARIDARSRREAAEPTANDQD